MAADLRRAWLLSHSPELFFPVGGRITARPMKGTRPRGAPRTGRGPARRSASSTKDRAENLMILDLMRNDIARIRAGQRASMRPLPSKPIPASTRWSAEGQLPAGRSMID
jgi:para-aminobenzoate synthetase/4-amino-4-deoxychorismate lyase